VEVIEAEEAVAAAPAEAVEGAAAPMGAEAVAAAVPVAAAEGAAALMAAEAAVPLPTPITKF
jgi:hypothetical protein